MVRKTMTIAGSTVSVEIQSADTKNLCGRYLYQITATRGTEREIPGQGVMDIYQNIDAGCGTA